MKFLAIEHEQPGFSPDDFNQFLRSEAASAWVLYTNGVLREAYFREDAHTAVLILECLNLAEANQVISSLPLVKAGLITFEVIPLVPYDGYSRLFES